MQPILVAVCGEEVASHFPSQFKLVYDTLCTFLPLSLHHCTTTCLSSTYCAFALERLHGKLPSTLPWQRKRRNDQHDSRNMWAAWWSRVTGKPTTLWLVEGHFLQLQQAPMQNQKLATRQRGPKNPRVRWMTPPPKKKGNEESNPVNWSTFHTSQGPIHAIKRNFSRALGTKTIKQPPSVLPPLLSSLVHALLLPSSAWPSAPPSGLVLLSSQKPAISETYGYDISWQFDFSLHS